MLQSKLYAENISNSRLLPVEISMLWNNYYNNKDYNDLIETYTW